MKAPASGADLFHIGAWIFDLDNTLYPAECALFEQIDARMTAYIVRRLGLAHADARLLQKSYYVRYGTTLSGLMIEHRIDPEGFLDFVHDIDLDVLAPAGALREAIASLQGRKYIFTNGSCAHAARVTARLGLDDLFDEVFDIRAAGFTPKPQAEAYRRFLDRHAVAAHDAAMFEDIAVNLAPAHALGMTTVLVCSRADWIADEPEAKRPAQPGAAFDHVHHVTDNLGEFLAAAGARRHA